MEFSTTKITPNDNVKIPSINGDNAGYMETDELKEYMNDGLITQSITDGDTDHAPSSDAVNGALNAIKSPTNKDANLFTAGGVTLSSYNQNTETSQYILDIATNRMQSFSFKTFYDSNGTEWFYLIGKGYPLFSGIRISHTGTLQKFYGDVNTQTVTVTTV